MQLDRNLVLAVSLYILAMALPLIVRGSMAGYDSRSYSAIGAMYGLIAFISFVGPIATYSRKEKRRINALPYAERMEHIRTSIIVGSQWGFLLTVLLWVLGFATGTV